MERIYERYPALLSCSSGIEEARAALIACFERGGKLLLCGNGGSCADCEHIVGELMKGFLNKRPINSEKKAAMKRALDDIEDSLLDRLQEGLPAISLPHMASLNSAFGNDVDPELAYAQAVYALAKKGDLLLAISTSGNARNVVSAARVAKALGLPVIAMTGKDGGRLGEIATVTIRAPESETFKVQELHLPIYHDLCRSIEAHFFG